MPSTKMKSPRSNNLLISNLATTMKISLDTHEIEHLPLLDPTQVKASFRTILFWSRIINLNITGVVIVTLLTF